MNISPISEDQAIKILKTMAYVGFSAILDYCISVSAGTTFGVFTPIINVVLVTIKQLYTDDSLVR